MKAIPIIAVLALVEATAYGGSIEVVNESSLMTPTGETFTASIREGSYGPELVVTGPVSDRTVRGERLISATLEIVAEKADGSSLWAGAWDALPGSR